MATVHPPIYTTKESAPPHSSFPLPEHGVKRPKIQNPPACFEARTFLLSSWTLWPPASGQTVQIIFLRRQRSGARLPSCPGSRDMQPSKQADLLVVRVLCLTRLLRFAASPFPLNLKAGPKRPCSSSAAHFWPTKIFSSNHTSNSRGPEANTPRPELPGLVEDRAHQPPQRRSRAVALAPRGLGLRLHFFEGPVEELPREVLPGRKKSGKPGKSGQHPARHLGKWSGKIKPQV